MEPLLNSVNELKQLNQQSLLSLPDTIDKPSYDRTKVSTGIVHIGVGGFHRAHQAAYTNELLKHPGNEQWGICGVGLMEANRGLRDILAKQDNLYTLTVRHPNGKIEHKVIGSMIEFLFAPENKQAVINKMASEQVKIISLTITEGGYNICPATGEFDKGNPDIVHDIANPNDPITAFGYMSAALKRRKELGLAGVTIQSCDNIQHNGLMTRKMLLAFLQLQAPELVEWVLDNVSFPNAMVDRITPVTTTKDIDYVCAEYGIKDEWPITCEAFSQWVIEDSFCNSRPQWEVVNAQFVPDVTPYEQMKIRLLNAGHSVLGLLGSLHGYSTIDETVSDPLFARFLTAFMDTEVTPVIDELPGIDLSEYKSTLVERFSNPNIKDNLSRICSESAAKLPKFLFPTVEENLSANGSVRLASLVIAAWCYYSDKQTDEKGAPLEIIDAMHAQLHQFACQTEDDSLAFLKLTSLFGGLINNKDFTEVYSEAVAALYSGKSVKVVMSEFL